MIIRKLSKLRAAAVRKPAEYLADALAGAVVDEAADTYSVADERWGKLVKRWRKPSPPPLPTIVPTPAEQTAWMARVLPICQECPAFGGAVENSTGPIFRRIKCGNCTTCGGKTVSAIQKCPVGKW